MKNVRNERKDVPIDQFCGMVKLMKTVFIYALCEPGSRTIRYIGKSSCPEQRLRIHWSRSRKRKNHLGQWLNSLSHRPSFLMLKEVPDDEWEEWERRYIRCARAMGFDLTNATDGGEGLHNPTALTIQNMRHAQFGKTRSAEHRKNISRATSNDKNPFFGKKHSLAALEKNRLAHLGRIFSPEECAARSARISGEKHPMFGKKHTDETRAKMRANHKSRKVFIEPLKKDSSV